MTKRPHKKRKSIKRTALISLSLLLSLILVIAASLAVYGNYMLGKINYRTEHPTLSQQEAESIKQGELELIDPTGDVEIEENVTVPTINAAPVEKSESVVNILLIGQDRRPGQGTQRSDSMILLTFNKNSKEITLTSIMRDQYVNIPGYGNDKLCHAYQYGGMPLLNQTLYNYFGIEVDGNVEVDFSGFEKIIDLLGGVEVELTSKEANHLNKVWGWNLKKGMNRMSGAEALSYARLRSIDSDYNRAERQQKVLMSLFEKYKTQSLSNMLSLTEELLQLVTTDIPQNQVMTYVLELFPIFSSASLENFRIPMDGTFKGGYIKVSETQKMWCQYNVDFEANRKALEKIFKD